MATRTYLLARCALLAFAAFIVLASFAACGRSNLDDYLVSDGGPTVDGGLDGSEGGGRCNAQTCPSGCCDSNDQCQGGDSLTSCGNDGARCANCTAQGFEACNPSLKACANNPGRCDRTTCGSGCCENGLCLAGTDPDECGNFANACQHCAQQGLSCQGRACTATGCGPQNCKGCCFGDQCVPGLDDTACGSIGRQCSNCAATMTSCLPDGSGGGVCQPSTGCNPQNCAGGCCDQNGFCNRGITDRQCGANGVACQNCAQFGETCRFQSCQPTGCNPQTCPGGCCQGNQCVGGGSNTACGFGGSQCKDCSLGGAVCNGMGICIPPPPMCNPQNCASGCCIGNVCAVGNQDTTCGKGGAQCQNCQILNEVCTAQTCIPLPPTCTPQNCAGCCDGAGNCQAGFLNNQCGQNGVACANCQAQGYTCDTAVDPRVCRNMQTTCPSAYTSCPGSVSTPSPPIRHVCAGGDLANARAACSAGAHTQACQNFFAFETTQKPACAACLQQFDYDFQELTGLLTCAAPFVSASCDHTTGCISDCISASCSMCAPGAVAQCQSDVRTGQCQQYINGAACIFPAFMGAGSFCSPQSYGGQIGAWLQGVGGHYCGP